MKEVSPQRQDMSVTERLVMRQRDRRGQRATAGASPDGIEEELAADEVQQAASSRRIRILRKRDAMAKVGMSESTFDDTRRKDPVFPEAIALGARAIGFVESELDDWLARQPRIRVCRVTADNEAEA